MRLRENIKKMLNNKSSILVFIDITVAIVGCAITIFGAFLNGLAIFNGSDDLSEGFGLILIGNSIALLGVIMLVPVYILSIFRWYIDEIKLDIT